MVAIDFHSMKKKTMEVKGYRQLFVYILQNILFCVQQKKFIQVWNNLKVSKSQNCDHRITEVIYPFKHQV